MSLKLILDNRPAEREDTQSIFLYFKHKLVGGFVHQEMKWNEHLQDNNESLMKSLRSRIGALKLVGKVAYFKVRKMIAEGIIMST